MAGWMAGMEKLCSDNMGQLVIEEYDIVGLLRDF